MEPSGALLGNAHGYIHIDSSNAIAGLNQTKAEFNNFIQSTASMMNQWGSQLASWGSQLTMWTAPIGLALGTGLNVAADFDSVLTEIQSRTGLTAEAMQQVKQAALEYGAASMFSSQQAADAFLTLLTAGLDVESALATLGPVLDAAAAGSIDLGTAADLTTTIMASFSLEASEATRIVDAMSRASAASPAGLYDIGVALADVGGDARTFGLSLEQTSAALAILAQNGKVGTEGATQLRSIFTAMTSTSGETAKAWEMVGSSLFDANGNARDFSVVLSEIEAGLQNLSAEDQAFVIQQLAGSYGRVGFNALLASDGIDAMIATMATQSDAATVAEMQMESFKGVVDSFIGSMETLWITVMTPYMNNVLRPMIARKTEMVNQIQAWAAANEPLIQTIVQIVGAALTLGPLLVGVGVAMQAIGAALSTVATVIAFALSPIGLLIAATGLLIYRFRTELLMAMDIARQSFNSFTRLLQETGDFVGSFSVAVSRFFGDFAAMMGMPADQAFVLRSRIYSALQGILTPIGNFINSMRSAMNVFSLLMENGVPLLTAFQVALGSAFGSTEFMAAAITGFARLQTLVTSTIAFIREAFNVLIYRDFVGFGSGLQEDSPIFGFLFGLRDTVTSTFARVLAVVGPALNQISLFFQNNTERVWGFIQGFMNITRLFNPIGQLSLLLQAFGLNFMTVFEGAIGGVTRFFEALNTGASAKDALKAVFGDSEIFGGFIDTLTNQVFPALEQMRSWFLDTVAPNIGSFMTGSLIPSISSFISILGSIWSIVGPTLLELGGWFLTTGMPQIMQTIERFANYLANDLNVGEGMRALADWFLNTALPPMAAFIDTTIIPLFQRFVASLGNIWNAASPALTSLGNWFLNDVMPQVEGIIRGRVLPLLDSFGSYLSNLWLLVQPHLQNLANWVLADGLPGIQSFITTTIIPAVDGFIGLLQRIWTDVEPHLTNLANWFFAPGGALDGIVNFLQTTIPPIIDGFITLLTDIWTVASPYLENLWNWFMAPDGALQGIATWLSTDVAGIFGDFTDLIAGIWDLVSPALGSFYNWFMGPGGGLQAIMEFLQGAFTLAVEGVTTMIQDMIGFINDAITAASNLMGIQVGTTTQLGGSGQNGIGGGGSFGGGGLGKSFVIPKFATGINFIPHEMIAQLHPGEAVVPANLNPYNPNAQTNGLGGGISFEGAQFIFPNARTREEGREVAAGFSEHFEQIAIERGLR
jgi:TP901 family phage tail tape measure protein